MWLADAAGGGAAVAGAAGLGVCCAQTRAADSASAHVTSAVPARRIDIHITKCRRPTPFPRTAGVSPAFLFAAASVTRSGRDARGPRSGRGRPSLLLLEREHEQRAGILRKALERLAPQRRKFVGHQAAPTGRHRNVLLAAGHVADDAGVVAHALPMPPQFLSALAVLRVPTSFPVSPQ